MNNPKGDECTAFFKELFFSQVDFLLLSPAIVSNYFTLILLISIGDISDTHQAEGTKVPKHSSVGNTVALSFKKHPREQACKRLRSKVALLFSIVCFRAMSVPIFLLLFFLLPFFLSSFIHFFFPLSFPSFLDLGDLLEDSLYSP